MRGTYRKTGLATKGSLPSQGAGLSGCALLHRGGRHWRTALSRVVQPLVRLHHYRTLRERALQEALEAGATRACGGATRP